MGCLSQRDAPARPEGIGLDAESLQGSPGLCNAGDQIARIPAGLCIYDSKSARYPKAGGPSHGLGSPDRISLFYPHPLYPRVFLCPFFAHVCISTTRGQQRTDTKPGHGFGKGRCLTPLTPCRNGRGACQEPCVPEQTWARLSGDPGLRTGPVSPCARGRLHWSWSLSDRIVLRGQRLEITPPAPASSCPRPGPIESQWNG